jgi:hypothetical protein
LETPFYCLGEIMCNQTKEWLLQWNNLFIPCPSPFFQIINIK